MDANNTTTFGNPIYIGVALGLQASIGLVVYVLFIFVVVMTPELRKNPFYFIAAALGVCDCGFLVLTISYSVPVLILQENVGGSLLEYTVGAIMNLFWFASFGFIVTLALNRYVAICKGKAYNERIFAGNKRYYWTLASVLFGVVIVLPSFHKCCRLIMLPQYYTWLWDSTPGATMLSNIELIIMVTVTIFVLLCNGRVAYEIRVQATKMSQTDENVRNQRKREARIFVQFMITVIMLVVFDLMFNILPRVSDSYIVGVAIFAAYIANCSINGYVYLLMSRTIRQKVRKCVFRTSSVMPATTIVQPKVPAHQ